MSDAIETEDLRSLETWLRAEDDLRGQVTVSTQPIRVGEMGGVMDAISVAIGNGGLAVILVKSIFTWLGTRRTPTSARTVLKLKGRDGRQAIVDLAPGTDPTMVIDKVLRFMRDDESGLWIDIQTGSDPA